MSKKMSELQDLDKQDLVNKYNSLKKELHELNFQRKMGRVEKPHNFKRLKKDIARILFLLNKKGQD